MLSLLLLGFIVYGTTVEAAHTHGNLVESNDAAQAAWVSDPVTATKLNGGVLGCGDCLICQLHQNFSSTLITFRQASPPPTQKAQFADLAPISFRSQTNTPRTGRAPPLNSL